MKRILLMCLSVLSALQLIAGEPISLKDITNGAFATKRISGVNPLEGTSEYAQISSDGRQVVKYSFKTGNATGVIFDLADAKGVQLSSFDDYQISTDGSRLLLQTNTNRIYRRSFTADFYLYDVKTKQLKKLSKDGSEQIPTFSPDGRQIAYVHQNNIYITDGENVKQVTTDGEFNKIINGLPDWVNEEEFGFNNALAWSADSKTLSWIKYDESEVKSFTLQFYKGSHPTFEMFDVYPGDYSYKYPKAGEANSKVSAWSYNLTDGAVRKYDLPLAADGYIPRIKTTFDANRIIVYTMNRHQDELNLYAANPLTGTCKLLIKESVPKYVKEEAMEGISIMKDYILVPSDCDGYMQRDIYVADKSGKLTCLSARAGWNVASFSGDYKYFLNTWSDSNHPYVFAIYDNKGKQVREVLNNDELQAKLAKYGNTGVEFFTFTTSEGVKLNGWMVKPSNFDATKKYPVIMHQYSGPGSQQVVDNWSVGSMGSGAMFDYYLTQKGYIVVTVDGRGTGARGAAFEKCTYLRLGDLESKDQAEAALWLGKQSYVDASRIGIWGWSFGGFNTLMSMSEGRNVFKAGVAIAPPTNWRYYDSVYTERYMRTPQENAEGYAINPINRAEKLHGKLLICHGLADDNVHPQNTFEYSEALVQADKDFKENLYTNRNHGIYGGNTRNHLLRQVAEWFINNL